MSGANSVIRRYPKILSLHCDTNGVTRRYFSCTRVTGEPPGDTAVALGYKLCQQEILLWPQVPVEPTEDTVMTLGTSVAARISFSDTRVPVEPPGDTLVTLV